MSVKAGESGCGLKAIAGFELEAIKKALVAPVVIAEDAGWRGDDLEAECFGYLAVRSLKKLQILLNLFVVSFFQIKKKPPCTRQEGFYLNFILNIKYS